MRNRYSSARALDCLSGVIRNSLGAIELLVLEPKARRVEEGDARHIRRMLAFLTVICRTADRLKRLRPHQLRGVRLWRYPYATSSERVETPSFAKIEPR